MSLKSRRQFIAATGKLLVGTAAFGSLSVQAADSHDQMHAGSGEGLAVDAAAEDTCATCQFWGGMRKISSDKKQVIVQSMGWCNNPQSMNHEKLTPADHMMKKPGIWQKWSAL